MNLRNIYVLSPHFDDAILSCGEHIKKWKKDGYAVYIIDVFTRFDNERLSPYIRNYLKLSGCDSVDIFGKKRIIEEKIATDKMGVKYIDLAFIDGGFRKWRDEKTLYQGEKNREQKLEKDLVKRLKKECRGGLLVAPLGIGGHVDHVLLRRAAITVSKDEQQKIWFYADFPYAMRILNWSIRNIGLFLVSKKSILKTGKEKIKILREYRSQFKLLFYKYAKKEFKGINYKELVIKSRS